MDPDIAPLARRLAEENNVEWRRLQGSGTDGRIVERDVLDFLARVMAGDEDVNPTPEPLPEGLDAWTDDAGRPLGKAAASTRDGRPSDDATPDDTTRDDTTRDDTTRDDERTDDDAADEDDLLLAGDDLLQDADLGRGDGAEEDLLLAGGTDAVRDASGPGDAGEDPDALPDLFDERDAPPRGSDGAPDLFVDDDADDRGGDAFDFGGLPGADRRRPADEDQDATMDRGRASDSYMVGDDADALSFGDSEASGVNDETAHDEVARDGFAHDEIEMDDPEIDAAEADSTTKDHVDRRTPVPTEVRQEAALPFEERGDDAVPTTESASAVPSAADVQRWPLARTRTVVRRHVDVGELLAVRRSVALEAGMDDVAAVAVLYLAAKRAVGQLNVERPGIALPDGSGGVIAIVPEHDGLAEAGRAVDGAARGSRDLESADADLWVVDLAGVGVDEAVLDTEVAQLVLGRLLSDDSDGSVRATMSLVADVPVERGAAFLARVADLLEDPLRLLA
ncbi:MAG: E3 binding domain-containing protein [Trueperaceae bacterium]|nr:E3 binding domain-containing protein [Trueperaceae bacterium]